jgi:hypothetical protein
MNPELAELLAAYPAGVQALALQARALILGVFPEALEIVDRPSRLVSYGAGEKYADTLCTILPYSGHVNLGFYRAVDLPDPERLLEGTGKLHRHVKVRTAADLERPALRELLEAAVRALQARAG